MHDHNCIIGIKIIVRVLMIKFIFKQHFINSLASLCNLFLIYFQCANYKLILYGRLIK